MRSLRRTLYVHLAAGAWPRRGLSPVNKAVTALVLASVVLVVLETEATLAAPHADAFALVNLVIAAAFSVEYLTRLWVMGEDEAYAGLSGRLRYALTPAALVDLLAILPFLVGLVGADAFLIRVFRLVRIFTLAKLGRYSAAMRRLGQAVASRRYELVISLSFALLIVLFSATILYLVEGPHQPDAFGSIPRALWWSLVTLTTVGYGDVYPVTALGKIFAALTALTSVAIIALPAGILAGAFAEAFADTRRARQG